VRAPISALPGWCWKVIPVTLREESARLRVPVLVGDEWFEVDICQNTLLVPRPKILGALDEFDCNPIATQRDVMERHNLIRAEPPPMRMPANKAFSPRSSTAQNGRDRIHVPEHDLL
jgi:hypothetical protein